MEFHCVWNLKLAEGLICYFLKSQCLLFHFSETIRIQLLLFGTLGFNLLLLRL